MKKFIIQNAYVIDGSGTPAFPADVLIEDGTIKAIGKQDPQQADMVIDAHGLTLAPGFINSHSHGGMMADLDDTFFQEAEQGVTTLIAGMCGISAAPFSMEHLESCLETAATVVPYDFSSSATKRVSYAGYLDMMDRPLGTNMAVCVGHGTLRATVMGMADREPDPAELGKNRCYDFSHAGGKSAGTFRLLRCLSLHSILYRSEIPDSPVHACPGRGKASADAVGSIRPQEDARCDPGRNDAGRTIRDNHVRRICHSS